MALTFTIPSSPGQHLNRSPFVQSRHSTKVANSSTFIIFSSNSKKTSQKIRSQKVKDKNPNAQSGGMGFAALDAFRTDKTPPKNIIAKTKKNDPQSVRKNEEKKNSIAHQEERNENTRNPSSEDSDLGKNEDVLHLNTRATAKPSLRGEDIILALQKVSAQKANEESRRKVKKKNASRVDSTRRRSSKMIPRVVGNVRPITVKPEWGARIESLENHLKELKERAELA
ncbi:hypothetical protein SUGI_0475650 [Cryptomeria japonica]|uniref:uncharacterized protein LOC131043444 n=1 Tax=Cryptomeria japonica TaxID=3369 RepID=UPI002408A286|nr:uncharacterized protein LOC131043444 [Cryptomeria japonica]GLJ24871.1 hypothetical protein SUGI_0475650 [Cryptomeria japonica]